MPPNPRKLVIIGGGAAGVFTAYWLEKYASGCYDITILERRAAVGGHAHSHDLDHDGATIHIDGGAQFFSETSQTLYCEMLREEGLFGHVTQHDAGVSVWDKTNGSREFWIPPDLPGLISEALANIQDWLNFLLFTLEAVRKYQSGDWTETFGDWLNGLPLIGAGVGDADEFRSRVCRPLMYQFGLVDPPDIDALSARFVLYYFVRSLPWFGGSAPFRLYNCEIGLDGVLESLVDTYGIDVRTGQGVEAVVSDGAGGYEVKTATDDFKADVVVYATNPRVTKDILPSGPAFNARRALFAGMNYVDVQVPILKRPTADGFMPGEAAIQTVSNVLVSKDASGDATHYMLSVWFGPLRAQVEAEQFVKSWGSPSLDPSDAVNEVLRMHHLMVGTPDFIDRRQQVASIHQGKDDLWYVGGWMVDYDSQNACLKASAFLALRLYYECVLNALSGMLFMSAAPPPGFRPPGDVGAPAIPPPLEPELRFGDGLPPVFMRLLGTILERAPDGHPAVKAWRDMDPLNARSPRA